MTTAITGAQPRAVMTSASQTWRSRKTASSRRRPVSGRGPRGMSAAIPANASTPTPVMIQKVVRQPSCCPTNVPNGTPSTLDRLSPRNIVAMALARFSGRTRSAATTVPTPMYAPCAKDATIRPAISAP
ncbi:hypothetical protein GCM10022416_51550 [Actinomadura keratinilytica]|uniref:Uncharacterized protein n=1 Tax=Actinomadura keratinilytica TaxID=547461 RepID=A0ABP7ZC20_9ACTN